jgi:hypothetical protein
MSVWVVCLVRSATRCQITVETHLCGVYVALISTHGREAHVHEACTVCKALDRAQYKFSNRKPMVTREKRARGPRRSSLRSVRGGPWRLRGVATCSLSSYVRL